MTKPLNFPNEKTFFNSSFFPALFIQGKCKIKSFAPPKICRPSTRFFRFTLYSFHLFAQIGSIDFSFFSVYCLILFFNGFDKYPTISFSYQFNAAVATVI